MADDLASWVSIIRSVCLTSKTPLTIDEIRRDVKLLEDRDVPYRSFEYRSLEDMVKGIPSLKVFVQNGKTVVQAKLDEKSAHIADMVRRQKNSKKKSRTIAPRMSSYRSNYNMGGRQFNAPRSGQQNRYNHTQNKYVPNRPIGHYSSQQSSYNRNQQSHQNGDQYRRTTTPPVTSSSAASRQPPTQATPKSPLRHPTSPTATSQSKSTTSQSSTSPEQRFGSAASSSSSAQGFEQRMADVRQIPSQRISQSSPPPTQQRRLSQPSPPPSQQQRLNQTTPTSQTPTVRSPKQVSFAIPTTTSAQLSASLQRQPSNVQARLNVQEQPRMTPIPMHDPRLTLHSYVQARNMPLPVYKDIPSKDKNIYSSVTVNSKKYSSYPQEAKTKDEAEKLAAQVALAELLDKSNMPRNITQNRAVIMTRVLDIVNAHPNGLFKSSLLESYVAKYNEGLPDNWLKIVEHAIIVDIGANNLTILSPQQDNASQQSRPISPNITEPPALDISKIDGFWFRVYAVYNSMDVWGVIIDDTHSDKINDLAIEMKHFYDINAAIPTKVVDGEYYAVLDSQNWHRVRCIKVDADAKTAKVFFIDRGDEDVFALSQLHDLSVKFYSLPAQAIQISLEGLEPFLDCDEMQSILEKTLLDEDVFVKVDAVTRQIDSALLARFWIEKDETENIDLNQEMIKEFLDKVVDTKNFMKTTHAVCEVYISEIRDKQIYVQIKSTGLRLLNDILTNLARNYLDVKPVKPAGRLDKSKLYLVKVGGRWMRIALLKELQDKVRVICIDEGSIIEVQKDNLVAVEGISDTLGMFPPQASQIHLHKISPIMFDEKMAALLRALAPKTDAFYMKVVGDREPIPIVELYKRTETNFLASLNDTLALEPEISSKIDDNNNNDKSKTRLRKDRQTTRTAFPLKTPKIPPIGEFFDVTITMAAHPSNFTVQPLDTVNKLRELMSNLAVVCNNYNGPPLTSSDVKVGSMYAAKYDNDGRWYRAYLSKILGKNICAVYFCDYGDYRAVPTEHLQPLANQFYDLPYQAIKAKLHGITPKLKGDWTVKDSLRFNELVVEKSFVSRVEGIDENVTPGETILSVELIDTSTEDDVYIIQQLIEEKRAERIVA